jgi:DNA-binding NtrC family response regulator
MIQYALKLTGGRLEETADRLGLSRKGLYLKRQRLAIQDAHADAQAARTA